MSPLRAVVLATGGFAVVVLPALAMLGHRDQVPAPYAGLSNPRMGDATAVASGAVLFQSNCATCHGAEGDGHGPAATGLAPPPANFRGGDVLARHSDAYLFYRISEGKPGTAMPSFRGVLDERERWTVITYLRTLGVPAPDR